MKIKMVTLLFLLLCLNSCYTGKVFVGDLKPPYYKIYTHKNHHFIEGLISVGNQPIAKQIVGDSDSYIIEHELSFVDYLISFLTGGVYMPSTTNFYVSSK
jgi:hypothetical protein